MPEAPDEITLVVAITPGVRFHDLSPTNGRELTTEDLVFSFTRLGTDEPQFQLKHLMAAYSSFQPTSPTTLTMKLEAPYSPVVTFMAHPNMVIVPQEAVEAGGGDLRQGPLNGTGPFMNRTLRAGVEYASDRNPNYFEEGFPYLDGQRTQVIVDPGSAFSAFRGGGLDIFTGADKDERERAEGSIDDLGQERTLGGQSKITVNTQHELFADPRIREAMHLGIDRTSSSRWPHWERDSITRTCRRSSRERSGKAWPDARDGEQTRRKITRRPEHCWMPPGSRTDSRFRNIWGRQSGTCWTARLSMWSN